MQQQGSYINQVHSVFSPVVTKPGAHMTRPAGVLNYFQIHFSGPTGDDGQGYPSSQRI